jgi:hypothetical protein
MDKLDILLNRNKNGDLEDLVRQARRLGDLAQALCGALPAELAADIVAANVREDGELVLVCRSPARAARLRFESDTLLATARAAGEKVQRLKVRVSRPD